MGDLREVVGHDLARRDVDDRRHRDAARVVGLAGEVGLLEPLDAEHRVAAALVEVEGPAAGVVGRAGRAPGDDVLEAEQAAHDDRAVRPRAGARGDEAVAAGLGGPHRARRAGCPSTRWGRRRRAGRPSAPRPGCGRGGRTCRARRACPRWRRSPCRSRFNHTERPHTPYGLRRERHLPRLRHQRRPRPPRRADRRAPGVRAPRRRVALVRRRRPAVGPRRPPRPRPGRARRDRARPPADLGGRRRRRSGAHRARQPRGHRAGHADVRRHPRWSTAGWSGPSARSGPATAGSRPTRPGSTTSSSPGWPPSRRSPATATTC